MYKLQYSDNVSGQNRQVLDEDLTFLLSRRFVILFLILVVWFGRTIFRIRICTSLIILVVDLQIFFLTPSIFIVRIRQV